MPASAAPNVRGGRGTVGGIALYIYTFAHTRGFLTLATVYTNSYPQICNSYPQVIHRLFYITKTDLFSSTCTNKNTTPLIKNFDVLVDNSNFLLYNSCLWSNTCCCQQWQLPSGSMKTMSLYRLLRREDTVMSDVFRERGQLDCRWGLNQSLIHRTLAVMTPCTDQIRLNTGTD